MMAAATTPGPQGTAMGQSRGPVGNLCGGQHPFGHEVEVTEQQVLTAFFNHLYLGQWELARACAATLETMQGSREGGENAVDVRAVLRAIIRHPHEISLGLESISSPQHLAWLASLYLKQGVNGTHELSVEEFSGVEFRLLLYLAGCNTPPDILQEVYRCYEVVQSYRKTLDPKSLLHKQLPQSLPYLPKNCLDFLSSVLASDVTLGHVIIQRLVAPTESRFEGSNTSLYQLYVTGLRNSLKSLDSLCGTDTSNHDGNSEEKEEHVQAIHSLLNYFDPPESIVAKLNLEALFLRLLRLANQCPDLLSEATLQASLLGRESDLLLRTFLKTQSSVRWESLQRATDKTYPQIRCMCLELRISYALSRMGDREAAWRDLLQWALEKKQHVLGKIVESSMVLIREGMYSELNSLLQPEEFSPLRPLLVLLGWGHVNSCSAAISLLETLLERETSGEADLLRQACQRLHQDVQLIQWCLEKAKPLVARYGGDPCLEHKAMAMFQGPDSHSLLQLLHRFTNLSRIDPHEGFQILNSRPSFETSPNGSENGKKTVRFAEEEDGGQSARIERERKRDCTIYRSFLVVENVMSALLSSACLSSGNGADVKGITPLPKVSVSVTAGEGNEGSRQQQVGQHIEEGKLSLGSEGVDGEQAGAACGEATWESCVSERLKAAQEHLSGLSPLTYRVEMLEDLFSLLFARYEDVREPDTDGAAAAMSDSGGEEGQVDEDWHNQSYTSLDSVESPFKEGALITEFTFSRSATLERSSSYRSERASVTSESTLGRSHSTIDGTLPQSMTRSLPDKGDMVVGDLEAERIMRNKQNSPRSNNVIQSCLHHVSVGGDRVGFLTNRRFMQEFLSMVKRCLEEVSVTKLTSSTSAPPSTTGDDIATSMKQTHLAQHIAQLTKRINEARWRFQLVSSHRQTGAPGGSGCHDDEDSHDEEKEEEEVIRTFFEASQQSQEGTKTGSMKRRRRVSSRNSASWSRSASGSNSGNERRKKRKRSRSFNSMGDPLTPKPRRRQDRSIVAQMLASEHTLLRMCLRRGNFAQAQQVIKIFDMKDMPEVSEVHFASHWQQAVSKLKTLDKSSMPSSNQPPSSPPPRGIGGGGLGGIASMAAAGIASLSVMGVVDGLLNQAVLPTLPQSHVATPGDGGPWTMDGGGALWQQLDAVNVAAMVVFDLACTACHSWKTCSELLDVAVSRLGAHGASAGPSPEGVPVGFSPKADQSPTMLGVPAFMQQLNSLINPISSSSTALIRPDVLEYFQRSASAALTTASFPLDPSALRANVNFILEVRRGIELLTTALHSFQADEDSGLADFSLSISPNQTSSPKRGANQPPKKSPQKAKQRISEIHRAAQQLLRALDKNVTPSFMMAFHKRRGSSSSGGGSNSEEQAINPANYLLTLYNHLSVLASLAVDAEDWQPGSERQLKVERDQCQNPFSILAESPSLLLGRLMFANQIPPLRLEGVAGELKLDLIKIIIQSCCPAVPMIPHTPPMSLPPPPAPAPPSTTQGADYVTMLNEGGVAGEWPHPVRSPCVVIEELLDKMITLMKKHMSDDGPHATFDLSCAAGASSAPEYWDVVMSTRELVHVDLDLIPSNDHKLCFFTNLLNLMMAHAALHHAAQQIRDKGNGFSLGHTRHFSLGRGITNPASVMLASPGINSGSVLDQLAYLSSMAYKVGQMGMISAFDLHFVILRSTLPVPSVYGDVLHHRLHALGEDDPWLKYIPAPDSRTTFVTSNGCVSSPRLRILTVDDLDEQLTVAMQNYLEASVRVDDAQNQITIPQSLEWFRRDFTGSALPADAPHGHAYMGLLRVMAPHVSPYLGGQLESYTLRYHPRHIEVETTGGGGGGGGVSGTSQQHAQALPGAKSEPTDVTDKRKLLQRSNSMRFKVVVMPFNHSYGYRFYGNITDGKPSKQHPKLVRRLSVPDNLDRGGGGVGTGWIGGGDDSTATKPPFAMTEPTLKYLHTKSKLVASLAGVVSAGVVESADAFAKDKSLDEDMLPSSVGSPASLVFEETFGSEREYSPRLPSLTKVLQHLGGYPIMQQYVQAFFAEVVAIADGCGGAAGRGGRSVRMADVRASLLADIRCKEVQSLFKEAIELLMSACHWNAALKLLDMAMSIDGGGGGANQTVYSAIRDFAAYCAGNQVKAADATAKAAAASKTTWQSLLTVKQQTLRGRAVLASVDSLPIEGALELLQCCVQDCCNNLQLKPVLETKLQQLRMYKKITFYAMQYLPPPSLDALRDPTDPSQVAPQRSLCTWQDVQAESKTNPDSVFQLLMSAADFESAREWAELHSVIEEYQQTIQANYLEHLLSHGNNKLQVYQLLEELPILEERVAVCSRLIDSPQIALSSVVFLVQYLLHHCLDQLSLERAGQLHDVGIGAKVLLCLPERVRGEYQHLMSRPDLLLEQLLMNLKMTLASDVQATLQEELRASNFPSASLSESALNGLVSRYAREAIQIPVALLNTSMSDTDSALNQSFLTSYASAINPLGASMAYRGRQFLASVRGRAASPSPSTTSVSSSTSSSVPVPDRRRILRGPSPGLTSPQSRRSSRAETATNQDQFFASPPNLTSRPSLLPDLPERAPAAGGVGVGGAIASLEGGQLPAVPPSRDQWVPDDQVTNCMVCQDRFSMFNRRHHCRRCGRVVCWKCSQLRSIVEGYGDTPVRICDQCYERFIAPRSYATPQSLEQRLRGKVAAGSRGSISPRRPSMSGGGASQSLSPSLQTPDQSLGFGGGGVGLGLGEDGLAEAQFGPFTDWRLSLDKEECTLVREDFYYEQAPSTSLCLSILELHTEPGACGHLLLQLCQELSEYLRPVRPGETNTEVDCSLVLSMMRTLLLNSKLKFLGSEDSASLELCDTYLGHVDLLNLFVSSNCLDIPSIHQLTKMDTARRIRDKLVLCERLPLAMELSTKCGLDPGAVWAAWGLSCLQAGDYEGAREKFSRILKAPSEKAQGQAPNKLLQDIISSLEVAAGQTIKAQDVLTMSASSIRDFISQPYKNASETETLMENTALKECLYYLQAYGSDLAMVQFYLRHANLQMAVNYLLQQQCSVEVFLEGLLVPCIREGRLPRLQDHMLKADPSLVGWHPYLTASCRHVNRLGWSHVLYQLQLFMKDFVRAAMTCIKFFQTRAASYSDLFERLHHVSRARDHMTAVLDDRQWGSVPRPTPSSPASGGLRGWGGGGGAGGQSGEQNIRLTLTPSELTKHLNTISLQIEVTTFLHRALGKNSLVPPTSPTGAQAKSPPPAGASLARRQSDIGGGAPAATLPTLFGNNVEKAEVVHKVLLAGSTIEEGFQLAFKMIQDFRLAETKIYSRAGRRLALLGKTAEIKLLLKCHRSTGLANQESCDEILDASVRALAGDRSKVKGAEELVKLMQSDTSKINAYLLIGRLRQAYLLAVKGEREDDVKRIAMAAERAEGTEVRMKGICEMWLREREARRRSAEQAQQLMARSRGGRS